MAEMQSPVADGNLTPDSPATDASASAHAACEACRARKIRCDKNSPCVQCHRADIKCVRPPAQRKEKRTRILLTPQYERKIDAIEHRLDGITKLLQDLKTQVPMAGNANDAGSEASRPLAALPSVSPGLSRSILSESTKATVVEGESSLAAHSVFVNDFLQDFVATKQPDSETQTTMDTLTQIVSDSAKTHEALRRSSLNAPVSGSVQQKKYNLPPIHSTVDLISAAQTARLAGTGWVYEYVTMQSFSDLCLKVYFSEERSPYDFISVNAGLFSLFSDHASTAQTSQDDQECNIAYVRLCRENLETALAELPLQLPASANVIAALLFGAFYSIEFSTSSLSWSLSSKASELCQTLGYHRKSIQNGRQAVSPTYAKFLFWTTYYLDKSLSLRLGRASTIQNWDITTSPPSSDDSQEPVLAFFALWIKTARCQGNIYEMLYAPTSSAQPDDVRQSRVDFLASSLHEIAQETEKTKEKWLRIAKENSGDHLMQFYAISDEILRLSLLTHVFRAAPRIPHSPTTFSTDCVAAARATLDRHHDCMAVIRQANNTYFATYINWTLLFAPFIPFIVLFCHVMETHDRPDLARLEAFVPSIDAATTVSEPAAKMHQLFQVLAKIAKRYVQFGMPYRDGGAFAPVATTMDAQLAALGFPRAGPHDDMDIGTHEQHDDQFSLNPLLWMADHVQLEDWLYTNQASMEVLQDGDEIVTWTE